MLTEELLDELLEFIHKGGPSNQNLALGQLLPGHVRLKDLSPHSYRKKITLLNKDELTIIDPLDRLFTIIKCPSEPCVWDNAMLAEFCDRIKSLAPLYLSFFLQRVDKRKVCVIVGEYIARSAYYDYNFFPEEMRAEIEKYFDGGCWREKIYATGSHLNQVNLLREALEKNIRARDAEADIDKQEILKWAECLQAEALDQSDRRVNYQSRLKECVDKLSDMSSLAELALSSNMEAPVDKIAEMHISLSEKRLLRFGLLLNKYYISSSDNLELLLQDLFLVPFYESESQDVHEKKYFIDCLIQKGIFDYKDVDGNNILHILARLKRKYPQVSNQYFNLLLQAIPDSQMKSLSDQKNKENMLPRDLIPMDVLNDGYWKKIIPKNYLKIRENIRKDIYGQLGREPSSTIMDVVIHFLIVCYQERYWIENTEEALSIKIQLFIVKLINPASNKNDYQHLPEEYWALEIFNGFDIYANTEEHPQQHPKLKMMTLAEEPKFRSIISLFLSVGILKLTENNNSLLHKWIECIHRESNPILQREQADILLSCLEKVNRPNYLFHKNKDGVTPFDFLPVNYKKSRLGILLRYQWELNIEDLENYKRMQINNCRQLAPQVSEQVVKHLVDSVMGLSGSQEYFEKEIIKQFKHPSLIPSPSSESITPSNPGSPSLSASPPGVAHFSSARKRQNEFRAASGASKQLKK